MAEQPNRIIDPLLFQRGRNIFQTTYMRYMARGLGHTELDDFDRLLERLSRNNPGLLTLDLSQNELTDRFVDPIIRHLISNENLPLRELYLIGNGITDDGANAILNAIEARRNSPLTTLKLAGNPNISPETFKRIESLRNAHSRDIPINR